jgi:hypothetical protein
MRVPRARPAAAARIQTIGRTTNRLFAVDTGAAAARAGAGGAAIGRAARSGTSCSAVDGAEEVGANDFDAVGGAEAVGGRGAGASASSGDFDEAARISSGAEVRDSL